MHVAESPHHYITNSTSYDERYAAYKDSGVEWLGQIPEHWEVTRLKYTSQLFGRIGFRGYTTEDLVPEKEGAITLSPSNMVGGEIDLKKCSYISWDKYNESPEIQIFAADVLIVKTGSTFGKVSYMREVTYPITLNPQIAVFKNIKSDHRYFYYYISANFIQEQISLSNTGSTIPTMTQETILGYFIPLPPLAEQKAIAAFLDRETRHMDTLIAKKEEFICLQEEKRSALISHAVTRGLSELVTQDSADFATWAMPVRFKDSGVEWLGEIPEHWEVKRLKFAFPVLESGVSVNSENLPADENSAGVLKTSCVYGNRFSPDENKRVLNNEIDRVSCRVTGNSLIISRMNTPDLVGNCGYVESDIDNLYLPDRLWIARFARNKVMMGKYSWYLISSNAYSKLTGALATGTSGSMKNLSQESFLNMELALPPLTEQEAIVSFLDRETARIDAILQKTKESIELLKEKRSALISAAVTGQIKVPEVR